MIPVRKSHTSLWRKIRCQGKKAVQLCHLRFHEWFAEHAEHPQSRLQWKVASQQPAQGEDYV